VPKPGVPSPENEDGEAGEALQRLSEAERLVLVLLRLGFTREDIAEHAGLSLQQLEEVIAHAMTKIRA